MYDNRSKFYKTIETEYSNSTTNKKCYGCKERIKCNDEYKCYVCAKCLLCQHFLQHKEENQK